MSNDIRHNLKSYVNAQSSVNYSPTTNEKTAEAETEARNEIEKEAVASSMNFLSAQGHAQVNMDNSQSKEIKALMEQFKQNPQLVESYIYFCDSLVNEGRSLEQAIKYTDLVFGVLKDENLYH